MRRVRWLGVAVAVAVVGVLAGTAPGAEDEAAPAAGGGESSVARTAALAASVAFVTAVSILGAAMAVGRVGSAALGAAAEKPELLMRALPFVALAEGLAVIGFIVAIALLAKI